LLDIHFQHSSKLERIPNSRWEFGPCPASKEIVQASLEAAQETDKTCKQALFSRPIFPGVVQAVDEFIASHEREIKWSKIEAGKYIIAMVG
jgi:hypothetical protein